MRTRPASVERGFPVDWLAWPDQTDDLSTEETELHDLRVLDYSQILGSLLEYSNL